MDIIETSGKSSTQKKLGFVTHRCIEINTLFSLLLFLLIVSVYQSTQASNYADLAIVSEFQSEGKVEDESNRKSDQLRENKPDSGSKTKELESLLADRAKTGIRNNELENDQFFTILLYSLSIATIILTIALIYFFINLKGKGKYMRALKKRMEKISTRKVRQSLEA